MQGWNCLLVALQYRKFNVNAAVLCFNKKKIQLNSRNTEIK